MYRNFGIPNKSSNFICLKCLQLGIKGIQRGKRQRERFHVKDLYCIYCRETTKQIELRYCDHLPDIMEEAKELHIKYYRGGDLDGNNYNEQLINA